MNDAVSKIVITTILNQRRVLSQLKEGKLSKADLEILTYASKGRLFCLNHIRQTFPYMNAQYIRRSTDRLIENRYLELMQKGKSNKPSYYLISNAGKKKLEQIVTEIFS